MNPIVDLKSLYVLSTTHTLIDLMGCLRQNIKWHGYCTSILKGIRYGLDLRCSVLNIWECGCQLIRIQIGKSHAILNHLIRERKTKMQLFFFLISKFFPSLIERARWKKMKKKKKSSIGYYISCIEGPWINHYDFTISTSHVF